MIQRILPLLFLLLLTSCYADELDRELDVEPFFDLRGYMTAQIDSLTAAQPVVEKMVVLNGTRETQQRDDIAWANDLRVFREADINKPDWWDKYSIERGEGRTVYVALDSSLQTRRLVVSRTDGVVTEVEIERRTGSVLSDGRHELRYTPGEGYRVRTVQENRFGGDVEGEVVVRF